ncbi:MAG: site-2 protease family protein [Romboutsia sp.]|uniref:site-2 protease family protein n=1 Tax=Romboutsia sp. TaxID=1965302 RepID=UPI003F31B18C
MDLVEVVIYILAYIVFMPVLVILHELGHAIVALIASKEKVEIVMGDSNLGMKFRISRLTIYFRGYKSFTGIILGYVRCTVKNRLGRIFLYLGGPMVSLAIAITLFFILSKNNIDMTLISNRTLNALLNYSLGNFIITIIPMKYNYYPYRGDKSDGYHIMKLLKGERKSV